MTQMFCWLEQEWDEAPFVLGRLSCKKIYGKNNSYNACLTVVVLADIT
jgi:hypothetical protein